MTTSKNSQPRVTRENIRIIRDTARVIVRPLIPGDAVRTARLIAKILALTEEQTLKAFDQLTRDYFTRHRDVPAALRRHYDEATKIVPITVPVTETQKLLIGAYFTMEYSIESAALFNPSIVLHPDQTEVIPGSVRFIMSLRATGEGHISSIVFRSGTVSQDGAIELDPSSTLAEMPTIEREESEGDSNYTARFHSALPLSERVIFPVLKNESKGIEDARFVRFIDDNGSATYYATYTAYDGFTILPQFIETKDFSTFNIITLKGAAVQNKGMALFPRKIGGRFVMLSRQDAEMNRIMFSDSLHTWDTAELIQEPTSPWELVQIGNCGSPLETDKGWLVLTHGVGPMRQYSIGAILLDLNDPRKVIAHLDEPLLMPNAEEREGYVPNVVYSCGSLIHNKKLILPYAMSDTSSGIATVDVAEVLACMTPAALAGK
jgi:predicted GH43/DUF377 family glycosyl hydrolase